MVITIVKVIALQAAISVSAEGESIMDVCAKAHADRQMGSVMIMAVSHFIIFCKGHLSAQLEHIKGVIVKAFAGLKMGNAIKMAVMERKGIVGLEITMGVSALCKST